MNIVVALFDVINQDQSEVTTEGNGHETLHTGETYENGSQIGNF